MIISHKKQRLHDDATPSGVYVPNMLPRLAHEFAFTVPPNTSGELRQNIPASGVVERVLIRIYQGAQLNLRLRPYIVRPRQHHDLITFAPGGKQWFDGDDDFYIYQISAEVNRDEAFAVWYHNLQATHTYDFRVTIEVNYAEVMD